MRKTAEDYRKDFSAYAIDAIFKHLNADDLLKSFKTTHQGVEVTKELQQLLANGGFQFMKAMSNERKVLDAFPPEHRAPATTVLDLNLNSLPTDWALAILQDVHADTFNLVVGDKSQPEKQQGILS